MQSYKDIVASEKIKNSWYKFKDNDKTIMSCHAGKTQPSGSHLEIGTLWYNPDNKLLKQYSEDKGGVAVWTLVCDLNVDMSQIVVNRGIQASAFNFNSMSKSGIYKINVSNSGSSSDWTKTTNRPSYKIGTAAATFATNNGVLTIFPSENNILQLYADVENGHVYTRTRDDNSWKAWARVWTDKTLTKVTDLPNDANTPYFNKNNLTAKIITTALGYTPLDTKNFNISSAGSPSWNNSIPIIGTTGILDIGRFVKFHPSSANSKITVTLDGGTTESGVLNLYGSSSAKAASLTVSGDVTAFSDKRLKTNIKTIENAIEKVKKIRGVTFKRRDMPGESRQTGVIAQEVQEVLPEVVKEVAGIKGRENYLTVAYGNMVGLLIEAIKEQQTMIEKIAKAAGVELVEKPKKVVRKKPAVKTEAEPEKAEKPKVKTARTKKRAE